MKSELKDKERLMPLIVRRELVWNAGPAQGGGGTAQDEMPQDHGYSSWWRDGELLLVIVDTNSGPEVSAVRVTADGDMLGFINAATDDEDFGWMDSDIAWWAKLDDILPQSESWAADDLDTLQSISAKI